jgi:hypothetical protein
MFALGFDKLLGSEHQTNSSHRNGELGLSPTPHITIELSTDYFPYVKHKPVQQSVLCWRTTFRCHSELDWSADLTSQLHDFFVKLDDVRLEHLASN